VGDPSASRAWHRAEAKQGGGGMEPRTASADRPALARPQARGRQPVARGRRRHSDHSAHARTREHSADAAIPQRDRRRTQEGIGSELEQQRPTASPCIGKLIDLVVLPDCPRFVPGNIEMWLRGRATSGICSYGEVSLDDQPGPLNYVRCGSINSGATQIE
jgi:hypothetical protein